MANLGARISYINVRYKDQFTTVNMLRPYDAFAVEIPRPFLLKTED